MGRNIESGSERPTSRSRRRNDGHRIVSGTCCNTARPSPKRRCLRSKHSRRDSLTGRHSGRAIVRSTFALRWTTFAWLANRSSRALASVSEGWSGLRGSNPCPRLGKPLYYHCTKPALTVRLKADTTYLVLTVRLKADTTYGREVYHARISPITSSRFRAINSGVFASRFSRSSGSVFDGRTLKCQSGYSTEIPSSSY
jgi:hypothetical protein